MLLLKFLLMLEFQKKMLLMLLRLLLPQPKLKL